MPIIQGIIASSYKAGGSFESIATLTAAGGETSLTFSSIPSTYKALQIRGIVRNTNASTGWTGLKVQPNSATSTYADHRLSGNGTTASANGSTGRAFGLVDNSVPRDGNTASVFGTVIIDVIDYASTSKAKTFRNFTGVDINGTGIVNLTSFLWTDTTAISSIVLSPETDAFKAGSTFALYGIKGE